MSFASLALICLIIPLMLISLIVKVTSKGPVIYWSTRVGQFNRTFLMPKFRTMHAGTPAIASHLFKCPAASVTRFGAFLRTSSLDELPQLWSIIKGDMSLVGPRPALFNQYDLIELRTLKGVNRLLPGLTGLAQISGRDDLTLFEKVEFDVIYLRNKSFFLDLKIIFLTVMKVIKRNNIRH